MAPKVSRFLIPAAFLIVSVVAVAGWVRKPAAPVAAWSPGLTAPCPEGPVTAQPAAHTERLMRTSRRPVRVVSREYVDAPSAPVTSHRRSTKKSVAIVGGSAGAGAAIGAVAGGGKGAAIGALSGGAAGFVYDRLTHERR